MIFSVFVVELVTYANDACTETPLYAPPTFPDIDLLIFSSIFSDDCKLVISASNSFVKVLGFSIAGLSIDIVFIFTNSLFSLLIKVFSFNILNPVNFVNSDGFKIFF